MNTSEPPDFTQAFQEAKQVEPFYRLPVDWPGAMRTRRDQESESTVWWRSTIYKAILAKRLPTELSHAVSWLEQVLLSKTTTPLGTTRFRQLLNLTFEGSYLIDGFPDAQDIELYALLAVLLINERKLANRVVDSLQTTDSSWFAENEAQIKEIFVVCMKLQEAHYAGEKDGRGASQKKGGKSRHNKTDAYRITVIDLYETDPHRSQWKNLGDACKKIHAVLKAQKVPGQPIPRELTVERWLRDHRQGIGFLVEEDENTSMSTIYI